MDTPTTKEICTKCVDAYSEGLDVGGARERERCARLVENLIVNCATVSTIELLQAIATLIRSGRATPPIVP